MRRPLRGTSARAATLALIGASLWALGIKAAAATTGCPPAPIFLPSSEEQAPLVTLVPDQAQGLSMSFGRSRAAKSREFFLTPKLKKRKGVKSELPPGTFLPLPVGTVLKLDMRPLERQEVDGEISPGPNYVAFAQVSDTKEVTVSVCIDPTGADVDPGTYVGSVRITDGRVEEVTVPITVTFQYPNYPLLISLIVVLLAGGSWYVWATSQRITGHDVLEGDWVDRFLGWLGHNIVAFIPATIAAGGAFLAAYWRNPAWGARAPEDWFTLLGATFAAFSATLAGAASIGKRGPAPPSPSRPGPDPRPAGAEHRGPSGSTEGSGRPIDELTDELLTDQLIETREKDHEPAAEGQGIAPNQRAAIDALTDKLIDKTEKLNYFIVTAGTAVLVFTFRDFNSASGLLRLAPIWLVAAGWGALLVSALSSLGTVRQGHLLYRLYIRIRNQGRQTTNPGEACRVQRIYAYMRLGEFMMIAAFLVGISGLVTAYITALGG